MMPMPLMSQLWKEMEYATGVLFVIQWTVIPTGWCTMSNNQRSIILAEKSLRFEVNWSAKYQDSTPSTQFENSIAELLRHHLPCLIKIKLLKTFRFNAQKWCDIFKIKSGVQSGTLTLHYHIKKSKLTLNLFTQMHKVVAFNLSWKKTLPNSYKNVI